jgi:hypothetical protein
MDFWERKRQELIQKGELPQARPEPISGPWWQYPGNHTGQQQKTPQNGSQGRTEGTVRDGIVDGHDVSKAMHLKSSSVCPMCHSGGEGDKRPGLMKPSASAATRCLSCGYVEGRCINEDNLMTGITVRDVPTLKVKQTADGGSRKDSTHLGASVADILYNNAILERSLEGRTTIG